MSAIKRFLYRHLSLENYLRLLQRSYFALYDSGLLRMNTQFDYHYNIRKIVSPGDVVIDIGANLGYYSIPLARRTGPQGHVHSVEPIPVYNKIFEQKARRYKNITLYRCALGPEEKRIEMVMPLTAGYLRTGLPHVYDPGQDERGGEALRFEAEMKNPAVLFGGLQRLDYVKCDVEGFEYEILSGMRDIFARLRPRVQVEVWRQNEEKVLALFDSMRYRATRLEGGRLVPLAESHTDGDIVFLP